MNKLPGKIVNIESADHISLVDIQICGDLFSCVVIETPQTADYLFAGCDIFVLFKETEVSVAKELSGLISMRNQFECRIRQIDRGTVLTKVELQYHDMTIVSIITTRSAGQLQLEINDTVRALVKANEVTLLRRDMDHV